MQNASDILIETRGLGKTYGDTVAVRELDLTVRRGEIFGLLGPNGAGKTTTILMLLGLTEPTTGWARVCGYDPTREPLAVKRLVGYLPDSVGFYDDMTGRQNLAYTAALNQIPPAEAAKKIDELLELVALTEVADRPVASYSRGMRQRLGLADVLVKSPQVLILDEPTLGIDPVGVRMLTQLIVDLGKKHGMTILLSSHLLHQVQQICDRVGLFVGGRLLASGPIDALAQQVFKEASYRFEIDAEGPAQQLAELPQRLGGLDGVERVEEGERGWLVTARRDVRAEAARTVLDLGLSLLHLFERSHGLDQIYEQFFKGGGADGANAGDAAAAPARA